MVDLLFAALNAFGPLVLLAVWAGSAGWAISDTRRRCPGRTRAWGGLAIALPVAGAALYALVRPGEDGRARRERTVWRRYLEAQLDPGERCLACLTPLEPAFRCCPGCGDELSHGCRGCGRELRIGWRSCPWCLAPVLEPARAEAA